VIVVDAQGDPTRPETFVRKALSDPGSQETRSALAKLIQKEVADINDESQRLGVSFLTVLRDRIAGSSVNDLPFYYFVSEQCREERGADAFSLRAITEVLPEPNPVICTAVSGGAPSWNREALESGLRLGLLPKELSDLVLSKKSKPEALFKVFRELWQVSAEGIRHELVAAFARAWRHIGMKPIEINGIDDLPSPFRRVIFRKDILPDEFLGRSLRALRNRWDQSKLLASDIDTLLKLPSFRMEIRCARYLHPEGAQVPEKEWILDRVLMRLDPREIPPALESRRWTSPNPISGLYPNELEGLTRGRHRVPFLRALLSRVPMGDWVEMLDIGGLEAKRRTRLFDSLIRAFSSLDTPPSHLQDFPFVHLAFNAAHAHPGSAAEARLQIPLSLPSLRSAVSMLGAATVRRAQREGWPDAKGLDWVLRHPSKEQRKKADDPPGRSASASSRKRLLRTRTVAREICRAFDIDALDLLTVLAAEAWKSKKAPAGCVFDTRYRTYTLPKKAGGTRTITEPEPHLKWLQRQLLEKAFGALPLPDCVHGFRPGHSILTNALPHTGQKLVVNIDIDEFFPSVKHPLIQRVCGQLHGGRLSPRAIKLLADICSFQGALPTGAPTSPAIGNAVLVPMDTALLSVCARKKISYTRYADDLTFSGGNEARDVIPFVKDLLAQLGLVMDEKKLNFFRRGRRQIVTGLVVNETPNLPRRLRRRLRAAAHQRVQGKDAHWQGKPMDDTQLAGRIAFLGLVRPEEARRLRSQIPVAPCSRSPRSDAAVVPGGER
jgi:retron-type reverse transcriptase